MRWHSENTISFRAAQRSRQVYIMPRHSALRLAFLAAGVVALGALVLHTGPVRGKRPNWGLS